MESSSMYQERVLVSRGSEENKHVYCAQGSLRIFKGDG